MENKDSIRVLLYSYYMTITGWRVLLRSSISAVMAQTNVEPQKATEVFIGAFWGLRVLEMFCVLGKGRCVGVGHGTQRVGGGGAKVKNLGLKVRVSGLRS